MRDNIMAKLKREFSSGGIVVKLRGSKPRILLIKDPYGRWTWPKGKVDKGEQPLEAARREIREETGLKSIRLVSKVGRVNYFYRRKKGLIYKTVHFYLFEFKGKEALSIQKEEIDGAGWFPEKQALAKVEYKDAKIFLKKAIGAFSEYKKNA